MKAAAVALRRVPKMNVQFGGDHVLQLHDVDVGIAVAIEDGLRTEVALAFLNTNEKGVAKLLRDNRTLIGLSDGGAHLSMLCDAGYCTVCRVLAHTKSQRTHRLVHY